MPHGQNSVCIFYKQSGPEPVVVELKPSVHFRKHESAVSTGSTESYKFVIDGSQYHICAEPQFPELKLYFRGSKPIIDVSTHMIKEVYYRLEAQRGYELRGNLWNPGCFRLTLEPNEEIMLIASAEDWGEVTNYNAARVYDDEIERKKSLLDKAPSLRNIQLAEELILAADQFIIKPVGRVFSDSADEAEKDAARTVIAGYHWFTDWGRDTMISLEGLTLTTGRLNNAKWILRTFAQYVQDGLIPNLFPEGKQKGLYHTADASLWMFHAVERYLSVTNDYDTLRLILPKLREIIDCHIKGTRFGIHVDHKDGLLVQGEENYQLTWMDAKVEGWVVTPRRGKAVEINALWYNALCIISKWIDQEHGKSAAQKYSEWVEKCRDSFNSKFWYSEGNYLYDVIEGEEGNDTACRPNQLFSISLLNPVLESSKWEPVLQVVKNKLLTPVGIRTLAPGHKDYKEKYFGDLRSRDAAYHQGTVWAWLIGPFIDAWLKVYPDDKENPEKFLSGFEEHLCESCVGSISEIFDAEAPFVPRGCIAQAWSVAEVLRAIAKLKNHN